MKKILAIVSAILCASTMLSLAACDDIEGSLISDSNIVTDSTLSDSGETADPASDGDETADTVTINSDVVTEDVWKAAFNATDVTNVTVEYCHNNSSTKCNEVVSEYKSILKGQRTTLYADDKIYSESSSYTENVQTCTDVGLETGGINCNESMSFSDKTYCLNYNGSYYSAELDTSEDSDGEWYYYEGIGLIGSCIFGYDTEYNFAESFSNFEYIEEEGAYIWIYDLPADEYFEVSMSTLGFSVYTYDYYMAYYVKINDGHISYLKAERVENLTAYGADNGIDYDYIGSSLTSTEYKYTNYGTTSVSLPDDITEKLKAL